MNRVIDFESLIFCNHKEWSNVAKSIITKDNIFDRDSHGDCVLVYLCWLGPDDPDLLYHFLHLAGEFPFNKIGYFSPAQMAARENKPKLLRALLDVNIEYINYTSSWHGATPFQYCYLTDQDTRGFECVRVLVDAGAKLPDPDGIGPILQIFITKRIETRSAAIAILCLKCCRSSVLSGGNGGDVLRVIARCVWSTRGYQ